MLPLVISMGEPAGIGPDILLYAWHQLRADKVPFVAVGNAGLLRERADLLGVETPIEAVTCCDEAGSVFSSALPIIEIPLEAPVRPGVLDDRNAHAVLTCISQAAKLAQEGKAAALITNPINKYVLYKAGFRFQGHTDFLAHLASGGDSPIEVAMMLANNELRTVPVTIHIAINKVPEALTTDLIVRQSMIITRGMRDYFGIDTPRIAVCGLNPHAGENGAMGKEEEEIIIPAIEQLRGAGIPISGPFAADSLFHIEARRRFDVALCMYHDQALIPVKTLDFCGSVNITLGLPYIRTSPDHGTALSLAGTGKANPSSLVAAIKKAAEMSAAASAGGVRKPNSFPRS